MVDGYREKRFKILYEAAGLSERRFLRTMKEGKASCVFVAYRVGLACLIPSSLKVVVPFSFVNLNEAVITKKDATSLQLIEPFSLEFA